MVVAGLTGGIATGKSTVARVLAGLGALVVDADRIAREVVAKGTPVWQAIRDAFGDEVLGPDGELDRDAMGAIIFSDPEKRALLNGIVHPAVYEEMDLQVEAAKSLGPGTVVVCDVPLLIETGMHKGFRDVILAYVPEDVQVERLMARDRISREQALKKVRSQMPIEEKRKYATIVIDNSGTCEQTREQVLSVYRRLSSEA
ncbi:MAG TPA: dephospho-CoA kinase [Deltaproteobacteria bacterium]|nr:dephospho-CoA kinase [Deltaproteobacteria bacterium]HOI05799.1 dephospho-CoA kinase [Deltaproteobacteria bacterium]